MSPFRIAYNVLRYLGPRIAWLRAGVYLGKALGVSRRRFAPRPWGELNLGELTRTGTPTEPDAYVDFKRSNPPAFLFELGHPPAVPEAIREAKVERQPSLADRLKLLGEDRCIYFFRTPSPEPIDWHANPIDGMRSDPGKIWCDIPDYLPEQGDPRMLWEPSRAAWAIDLARAPVHGYGDDAGRLFWRWFDSWMEANPPYLGFQWKCGQESSVRMIAIAMGFWSLANDATATPERWLQFARFSWATGYRVHKHINYALSQKNNHAMSEACGLMLISRLFPEFRDSARWWAKGRHVLGQEIHRQTYADGSYLQQSMNYERVMLHGSMLGLRLAELAGEPVDRSVYDRLGHCGEFLFQMMDPDTGRLPQYGPNDGAWVLPLSECDFNDFRPAIQAVHYLCHRERLLPPGPWDEDLIWLFGPEAAEARQAEPRRPTSSAFEVGGYYTLRRPDTWAMIRCHTYRDRTGQCDPLQLDLWWRGQNILQDCGTYHYSVPGRKDIERYFKSTAAHNIVEIDGEDPLELVSRFLFFPWTRAERRHFSTAGDDVIWFEGEHYDYDRRSWKVLVRRTVVCLGDIAWVVVDDLLGEGEHDAVLRWHMVDVPHQVDGENNVVHLHTPSGEAFVTVTGHPTPSKRFEVVRGRDEQGRVQGFASPYYGERLLIPTLEVAFHGRLPQRVVTVIGLGEHVRARRVASQPNGEHWEVPTSETVYTMRLAGPRRGADRTLLGCSTASDVVRSPASDVSEGRTE